VALGLHQGGLEPEQHGCPDLATPVDALARRLITDSQSEKIPSMNEREGKIRIGGGGGGVWGGRAVVGVAQVAQVPRGHTCHMLSKEHAGVLAEIPE
jgi:hypothetical protein